MSLLALATLGFLLTTTTLLSAKALDLVEQEPLATPSAVSLPRIAWLLSFPNSGTTFTLQAVRQLSNRTIAANTCLGWVHERCERVPILRLPADSSSSSSFDESSALDDYDYEGGPYRISKDEALPETYVLTRTHCAGHWPFRRTVPPTVFAQACRQTARVRAALYGLRKVEARSYPHDVVVQRAIHLWRHPFDNVMARFRHARRFVPLLDFSAYCRVMDALAWRPSFLFSQTSSSSMATPRRRPPCWSELERYLQWHDNALHLQQEAPANNGTGTMTVLHVEYEDYAQTETYDRILDFLQLERRRDNEQLEHPFVPNRTYGDLLSKPQMTVIWQYLKHRASPRVWERLARYYNLEYGA